MRIFFFWLYEKYLWSVLFSLFFLRNKKLLLIIPNVMTETNFFIFVGSGKG